MPRLMQMHKANPHVKVFISGDKEALHGDVIKLLDRVRSAGIEKVGYEIKVKAGAGCRRAWCSGWTAATAAAAAAPSRPEACWKFRSGSSRLAGELTRPLEF